MPVTRFKIGDRVQLNRAINGKNGSFELPIRSTGRVVQVYLSGAIRVDFDGHPNIDPVVAARYLDRICEDISVL